MDFDFPAELAEAVNESFLAQGLGGATDIAVVAMERRDYPEPGGLYDSIEDYTFYAHSTAGGTRYTGVARLAIGQGGYRTNWEICRLQEDR
jgi:hypothetical protein